MEGQACRAAWDAWFQSQLLFSIHLPAHAPSVSKQVMAQPQPYGRLGWVPGSGILMAQLSPCLVTESYPAGLWVFPASTCCWATQGRGEQGSTGCACTSKTFHHHIFKILPHLHKKLHLYLLSITKGQSALCCPWMLSGHTAALRLL